MKRQGIPAGMLRTKGHPILLLWFRGSTGTSFSILGRNVTALLERRILVFKDVLNAKFLPFQTRLRARTMSERARQGLLRPGHRGDPTPTGWQDVNPNPVHTKTCRVTHKIQEPSALLKTPAAAALLHLDGPRAVTRPRRPPSGLPGTCTYLPAVFSLQARPAPR